MKAIIAALISMFRLYSFYCVNFFCIYKTMSFFNKGSTGYLTVGVLLGIMVCGNIYFQAKAYELYGKEKENA